MRKSEQGLDLSLQEMLSLLLENRVQKKAVKTSLETKTIFTLCVDVCASGILLH